MLLEIKKLRRHIVKYLTEEEKIYIEDSKVFKDGNLLNEGEYMFYSSYISNINIVDPDLVFEVPEVGIVLVIFSGETGNITEQVKITDMK